MLKYLSKNILEGLRSFLITHNTRPGRLTKNLIAYLCKAPRQSSTFVNSGNEILNWRCIAADCCLDCAEFEVRRWISRSLFRSLDWNDLNDTEGWRAALVNPLRSSTSELLASSEFSLLRVDSDDVLELLLCAVTAGRITFDAVSNEARIMLFRLAILRRHRRKSSAFTRPSPSWSICFTSSDIWDSFKRSPQAFANRLISKYPFRSSSKWANRLLALCETSSNMESAEEVRE